LVSAKGGRSVIIIYIANDDRAALDIKELSKYSEEKGVLILRFMDFEVTQIDLSNDFGEIILFLPQINVSFYTVWHTKIEIRDDLGVGWV